jgi:hypothetical protein
LSIQFRDNAVFQADKPLVIWGSTGLDMDPLSHGETLVHFDFAGHKEVIKVTEKMEEWRVTVPPLKASTTPKTLTVSFTINGKLVHERICKNILVGDVWYVGTPPMEVKVPAFERKGLVRVIKRLAKRDRDSNPSRFSIGVSTGLTGRFTSKWEDAEDDLAGYIGHRIAAKTGRPVGIVFMESKFYKGKRVPVQLKHWIPPHYLNLAENLVEDYKIVSAQYPESPYYKAKVLEYVQAFKDFWANDIAELIDTKQNNEVWGSYPRFSVKGESDASSVYNVMVHPFTPMTLKGIIFITDRDMLSSEDGHNFAGEMNALGNGLKRRFGDRSVPFLYTMPSPEALPKLKAPDAIKGSSKGFVNDAGNPLKVINELVDAATN